MKESNISKKIKYPQILPLWIGLFVDILGFYIIIPFLPLFIKVFNTTPFVIGLILATNAFFTLIFAPIWGKVSDKIGRKPVLIISQMGTFSAFILLAFSDSILMLFIARMVDGIFGGNFPMVKSIISDTVPPKDRGPQMANVGVIHVLAGLAGPGVGGLLSTIKPLGSNYPIAAPGFGAASLSFVSLMITIIFINESWPKEKRKYYQKHEKIKLNLRNNKDATWLLVQYAFHTFSFTMYIATLTIYIGLVLGLDTIGISILLTISGISRAIIRFSLFNLTLKKLGENKTTILGLFVLVITFLMIGFVRNVIEFLILAIFISYGVSCSRGLLISKVTQSVSPKEVGKINGYTTTLDSLAQISGPIIGTLILSILEYYWYGIILSLLSLVAFLMIFKKITLYHEKIKN
ncbi:MAG: MFS transporter [Promethearchaeota archaeon]